MNFISVDIVLLHILNNIIFSEQTSDTLRKIQKSICNIFIKVSAESEINKDVLINTVDCEFVKQHGMLFYKPIVEWNTTTNVYNNNAIDSILKFSES